MSIARRLIRCIALPIMAWGAALSPVSAADVLQCVPYARAVSGISIHGDAWTWWNQAKGMYQRGYAPRPGAVLALANSNVMPLGHVAVVSRILDERRILLRHANWSAPGLIEQDVLAIDASAANDWSQVRIWWGQSGQMGARLNPVNGFIYPAKVSGRALSGGMMAERSEIRGLESSEPDEATLHYAVSPALIAADSSVAPPGRPQLAVDASLFRMSDAGHGQAPRTLAMIVHDVQRDARLR